MKKIALDIWWTKIIWVLFDEKNEIIKTIKIEIWEYVFEKVILKIQNLIDELIDGETNYIWISLNWQINKGYIKFSRVLGWVINKEILDLLKVPKNVELKVDNDVNCMCRWAKFLDKNNYNYYTLLNIWTGLRSSYLYKWNILKWKNWYFWEIRDDVDVLDLNCKVNLNDLVCGRWISTIYKILTNKLLDAKDIYNLSKNNDEAAIKTIEIFKIHFVRLICRISYTFNPEIIVIDWSVKELIRENYKEIIYMYDNECEPHFQTKIEICEFENTPIFWALFIE